MNVRLAPAASSARHTHHPFSRKASQSFRQPALIWQIFLKERDSEDGWLQGDSFKQQSAFLLSRATHHQIVEKNTSRVLTKSNSARCRSLQSSYLERTKAFPARMPCCLLLIHTGTVVLTVFLCSVISVRRQSKERSRAKKELPVNDEKIHR